MNRFRAGFVSCVVGGLFAASAAQAQSLDEVQFWVGSGANRAGFVVDWNDGKDPQSLMWGYRWDGEATGEEMLHAIVSADARLFAHVSNAFGGGLGTALFGMGYDLNNSGNFAVDPALAFDADGYSVGGAVDGRDPADAADHWQEGWFEDGFWSYWVSDAGTPSWGFSGLGMSSRILTDGAWDAWSYAPGFNGEAPSTPVPASVPAPAGAALLGLGGVVLRRRRRRAAVAGGVAALAVTAAASAQYQYDPNDFAVEVVDSVGLSASGLYDDPQSVLDRPALQFLNSFPPPAAFRRVKLIEPAFNTGLGGARLITTLNAGQSVTVRMGRRVFDDPNNPFGVDLNVFGNAFFSVTSGGFVDDSTNLNTTTVGGVFGESVRVSVSPDNVNWYTFDRTGDGYFPTNSYAWDRASASWTNDELDPTKPIDPELYSRNFTGMTAADVLDLYNGSAGGTGFDLAGSGFEWIEYVRVEGAADFWGGEIDAIAAVRPIPAPGAFAFLGVGGLLFSRRRR